MFLDKLNEVLASKKSFISDRLNFSGQALALLINIIHWVVLVLKIKPQETNIVLHYNVIYGADLVDKASFVYVIPAVASLIFLINLLLANYIYKREKLAGYFLTIASVVVQIVFLVATLTLISINDR